MQVYTIDYAYSDLPEEEIAAHVEQMKAEAEQERMEKARAFRFVAGFC